MKINEELINEILESVNNKSYELIYVKDLTEEEIYLYEQSIKNDLEMLYHGGVIKNETVLNQLINQALNSTKLITLDNIYSLEINQLLKGAL